jgi:hypothetical protein
MYYSDGFVESLPKDFDEAVMKIMEIYDSTLRNNLNGMMETRYLIETLATAHNARIRSLSFKTRASLNSALSSLLQDTRKRLQQRDEQAQKDEIENSKERFSLLLNVGFAYEFSKADIDRIQSLINDLRGIVSSTEEFSEDHRGRVLSRLEKLQQELHQRMSNLDRFYGLVGDAGIALGKFGHNSKPFVDRIREIIEIVWRSQATAEQLPASARPALLNSPDGKED